jgi:hypothetical protein
VGLDGDILLPELRENGVIAVETHRDHEPIFELHGKNSPME